MVTITLEENEIDAILNLVNRKIEKINDKEIDDLKNHILIQVS